MRRVARRLRGHFGATARKVAVRSQQPWYWQWIFAIILMLLGYLAGYMHFGGGDYRGLINSVNRLIMDNQSLEAKTVYRERQLQVERAAQQSLAGELAALQDESMRLKEELAFYKGILSGNTAKAELKLHSFKVNKGKLPNQYEYHVLLIQAGRHDKMATGELKLTMNGLRNGEAVSLPLHDGTDIIDPAKVNFKYYQRIDGQFLVPEDVELVTIEASLTETGVSQPKLRQKAELPA